MRAQMLTTEKNIAPGAYSLPPRLYIPKKMEIWYEILQNNTHKIAL